MDIIAQQLRRLFAEYANEPHFDQLENLIVNEAYAHVKSNQVHGAALLGISRNVMRTLLKRHGLLADSPFRNGFDKLESIAQIQ
jgi:DNA-binding protein Fis